MPVRRYIAILADGGVRMKLSKKQSIIAVSVLFAVVAGILVTGFFFSPIMVLP